MTGPIRVLAVTNMWPFEDDPSYGAFVAAQMHSVEELGVQVEVMFVNGRRARTAYLRGALRLLALNFGRRRYDLVHAHTGHCGVLARFQVRYPVLVSYVGYDILGKGVGDGSVTTKSRIEAAVFRRLARVVTATITKSAQMEGLLPAQAWTRNTVLPNGVDRSRFRPVPRDEARAVLGWSLDEPIVLFAGRTYYAGKRFSFAQRACELAAERVPGVRLVACERQPHDRVPLWMSAADVLILPSLAEGSPNVVKEALACNLPVVATDVGDIAELLDGVSRCRLLPLDADVEAAADALVELLAGLPERSDGRERTAHLASDVVAQRLVAIYASMLDGARARVLEPSVGDAAAR